MDLDLGPEIAEFRAELHDWIGHNAPDGLAELADWNMAVTAGGYRGGELAKAAEHPSHKHWEERLSDARLICPQWPGEFGGQGMDGVRLAVLNEEFHAARLPRVRRGMGESLVGPSIIVHGSDDQRAHFLPRIISGDDVYCQGFSEPDHGSDLAGVQTKAELCRSDPELPKHAGLSYVLLPFNDPGVTYRPIRQISGASEFCEDFIDNVRVPMFNVIGGLNNGWKVAMTTLGHERGGAVTVQHLGFEREFWELIDTTRKYGKNTDPLVRQDLARAYTGVQIMRFNGLRALAQAAEGRPPGPEASIAKLVWSEYHRWVGEVAIGITGTDGLVRPDGAGYPTSEWQNVFLSSRAGTIYSGTSEIQRNIISERALGLPKEPRHQEPRHQEPTQRHADR
jgi:alkylation response protein AidB-like acyl-CoA dehydrogenase